MASPTLAATNKTDGSSAATNKVCNLPATIAPNDLLLLCLRSAGADTHVTPTGWTSLFLNDTSDASDDSFSLWYKLATASDVGLGTVTVNGSASVKFASISWRVTGHANPSDQAPQFATLVVGTNTTPDPGTVTPTGGSKDYLFLWLGSWDGEQTTPPAAPLPTNYTSSVGASSGTAAATTTNCQCATASRQATASSENPGTWTISVAPTGWTATVVAIHPYVAPTTAQNVGAIQSQVESGGFVGRVFI